MSRILFAQAETDDRAMYAEALRFAGFDVIEASTTDIAATRVAEADALITGLMVPGHLSAIDLIAGARQGRWRKSVPVVVVTACTVPWLQRQAEEAGASPVLTKPCLPDDLVGALERVLDLARRNPAVAITYDVGRGA